jgi:signal transduction histidine kinase
VSKPDQVGTVRRRLNLATGGLLAGTAALVLALVYGLTTTWFHDRVDDGLDAELEELLAHHRTDGASGLAAEIDRRTKDGSERYYLLVESFSEAVAGNLTVWPEGMDRSANGWTFSVERTIRGERRVRCSARTLPGDRQLLVGEDVTDHVEFEKALATALLVAFGVAVLLAIAGGLAMSRSLLRRVEDMNRTIGRILGGRSSERVELGPRGDEFDALAGRFNALLDENARLVKRVRGVTDDIAHDLRTPLARVRGRLEAALVGPRHAERDAETLREVIVEVDGILETFQALLDIARLESGQAGELAAVDVSELVQSAAELYEPLAEEAGLSLITEVQEGLMLQADRHLLAQALTNLLDNAIKYGQSPIEMTARHRDSAIEIVVTDRGPGIPEEDRARVLERFVRLDSSRQKSGTGLGLSFVAAVADLHDARLDLDDRAPGLSVKLRFAHG